MSWLKHNFVLVLVVLVLAFGGVAFYFYNEAATLKSDPGKVSREEAEELIATVSKLIVLPEGEVPTIATVADPEKLKSQLFFSKAQKGDKVLIYTNAKKAILYSPTTLKIVEVAPLNIGNSTVSEDEENSDDEE